MNRLANKVAIVFGAGPNIGGTTAYFLAREGAKVVVSDISLSAAQETVDFIRAKGFEATATQGNATVEEDVCKIVDFTVETYGRVDVAVNMAGRVHWSHLLDMDMDDWKDSLLSFPTAGLLTTKYVAKAMIAGGHGGSIIHLLSTAAHFGEATGAAYTSSKAALLSFARSAALDLAHYGIRVNTVTPCAMELLALCAFSWRGVPPLRLLQVSSPSEASVRSQRPRRSSRRPPAAASRPARSSPTWRSLPTARGGCSDA